MLVPPTCVGLPNRDAEVNASPSELAPGCVVRIDVHGSKDRAKDASPEHMRDFSCLRRVHVLCGACATAFPSSAPSGHPLSSARRPLQGDTHSVRRTDLGLRSDDAPRRAPPSRRPGCLSPPRHVKESIREGMNPSGLHAGSLAHAAHTLSTEYVDCVFEGHCKVTVVVTHKSVISRVQTPF